MTDEEYRSRSNNLRIELKRISDKLELHARAKEKGLTDDTPSWIQDLHAQLEEVISRYGQLEEQKWGH